MEKGGLTVNSVYTECWLHALVERNLRGKRERETLKFCFISLGHVGRRRLSKKMLLVLLMLAMLFLYLFLLLLMLLLLYAVVGDVF